MKCKECGNQMILDDKDFKFTGCVDKYWECEKCNASCLEEIRYSQTFKEHWVVKDKETDLTLKQYTIKHYIDFSVRIKRGELR